MEGKQVVVATTKVQIFKQITTSTFIPLLARCCCCYHKGTNFQANHNKNGIPCVRHCVVVATTKVQIFKQITTERKELLVRFALLLLPQRYKFSSKSQPAHQLPNAVVSCCCYHKGTNFQANHNWQRIRPARRSVVVATTKVQIFKQITMVADNTSISAELLLLPQRYKFSSKSQQ